MADARPEQLVHADWTWVDGRLQRGLAVSIAEGKITSIAPPSAPSTMRLGGKALIPGFVSAHSHAFQRGLRGTAERASGGAGNFFSWRESMYDLASRLTAESCYDLSKQCFAEMLAGGITSVGEFHYVRHLFAGDDDERDELRYALDAAVLSAARDAGIRIALLHTCYMTGGFGRPLAGGQLRFRTRDEREYWARFDDLCGRCDAATQSVATTAHSVRAVPIEAIERLHRESARRGVAFHMHLEEVRQEIVDCVAAHGVEPAELLLSRLAIDARCTFVHCTHTKPEHLARLASTGATVCLCPLTEANLGDGVCDVGAIRAANGAIAFGTDLNSRLSPTEELRWIEYVQRLCGERRGAVVDADGSCGEALMTIGTRNGARSLGIDAGEIAPGKLADFAIVDLNHSTMANWTPETFASHLIFGTGTSAVCGTCVGGRWKIRRA